MKTIITIFFILIISGANQITAQKITDHLINNYHKVYLNEAGNDSVNIYYTGCGGYLIKDGESALMLDPYFSNITPMLLVRCKKLKSNSDKINSFFTNVFKNKKDQNGVIKAILVAHSHYDHLADVPYIFNENINVISHLPFFKIHHNVNFNLSWFDEFWMSGRNAFGLTCANSTLIILLIL